MFDITVFLPNIKLLNDEKHENCHVLMRITMMIIYYCSWICEYYVILLIGRFSMDAYFFSRIESAWKGKIGLSLCK